MFQVTDGHAIRSSCGGASALFFRWKMSSSGVKGDRSRLSGCFRCILRIILRVSVLWLWFEFEVNWRQKCLAMSLNISFNSQLYLYSGGNMGKKTSLVWAFLIYLMSL